MCEEFDSSGNCTLCGISNYHNDVEYGFNNNSKLYSMPLMGKTRGKKADLIIDDDPIRTKYYHYMQLSTFGKIKYHLSDLYQSANRRIRNLIGYDAKYITGIDCADKAVFTVIKQSLSGRWSIEEVKEYKIRGE